MRVAAILRVSGLILSRLTLMNSITATKTHSPSVLLAFIPGYGLTF